MVKYRTFTYQATVEVSSFNFPPIGRGNFLLAGDHSLSTLSHSFHFLLLLLCGFFFRYAWLMHIIIEYQKTGTYSTKYNDIEEIFEWSEFYNIYFILFCCSSSFKLIRMQALTTNYLVYSMA